jgi:hypothetical protein
VQKKKSYIHTIEPREICYFHATLPYKDILILVGGIHTLAVIFMVSMKNVQDENVNDIYSKNALQFFSAMAYTTFVQIVFIQNYIYFDKGNVPQK